MIELPQKIVCVGMNYHDHAEEQGIAAPPHPILFAKWPNTIVGDGDEIVLPANSTQIDFEAELGFVIGRVARNVQADDALDFVRGYVAANDVSCRDVQFADGQWVRGKSFDTFLPVSDLMPATAVDDPHALRITTRLNGTVMQDSNTSNLIFDVAQIVEFVTQNITLVPGDLVITGTPAGVGAFRTPPVWLEAGDEVTIEVEQVGSVRNVVARADARTPTAAT
jgi:2-keto-4-pentenoate hydratase/2-oxohepta-3-ene-1,7-dioic acid hydratase in catechol pathway